jgi:predicted permease
MTLLLADLRTAIRRLRRSPAFTLSALVILILCIGANSTIFTVVNRFILQPLPVHRPGELVSLNYSQGAEETPTFSYPDYLDLRDSGNVLSNLAAFRLTPVAVSSTGSHGRAFAYLVSGNYFGTLGVGAHRGRILGANDDVQRGAHPVAVLQYGFWQRRFGGDPGIVGSAIKLNGLDYTVVGVAPEGFFGTERILTPDLFVPMLMQEQLEPTLRYLDSRRSQNIFLIGRLAPGVSRPRAQAALNAIATRLAGEYPEANRGMQITLSDAGLFGSFLRGPFTGASTILLLLAGMVLLVACANVAGLLLARASARRKEIAVRLAIGASRWALVRESFIESLVLSITAGVGGLLLAWWLRDLISAWAPPIPVPLIPELAFDWRVIFYTVLASLAAGVFCGLMPGLQASRASVISALKQEHGVGRLSRWRVQDLLTGAQVALSTVLLIGSMLVIGSLGKTLEVPLGFDPQQAASAAVDLNLEGYSRDRATVFQRDLIDKVRALPGVQSAALAGGLPLGLEQNLNSVFVEGEPEPAPANVPSSHTYYAGDNYLRAMGTRLLAGRDFEQRDEQAAVAIVNQTFAQRLLSTRDPIGARFRLGSSGPWTEIIGVVENGKYVWLAESPQLAVFLPIRQNRGLTTVVARSSLRPSELTAELRRAVLELDSSLSVFYDGPLTRRVDFQFLPSRFLAGALSSFGVVGVLLVAAGIYGIVAYSVARRTREIGIRIALGAAPATVLRTVVARAAILVVSGTLVGLAGGLALGNLFASVLYGVDPYDPLLLAGALALMVLVGTAACWGPIRRAIRIDPLTALRAE